MQKKIYDYKDVVFLDRKAMGAIDAKRPLDKNSIIKQFLMLCSSFFIGRVLILDNMAPFGISLYASLIGYNANPLSYLISIVLGIFTRGLSIGNLRYIGALSMLYLYIRSLGYNRAKGLKTPVRALAGFASISITNIIYLYIRGFIIYDVLSASVEGLIVFTMVYVFRNVSLILSNTKKRRILSNEEIICISIFISLVIVGFWDNGRLPISIKNVLSIYVILLSSYVGGASIGATTGILIGLILSLTGTSDMVFVGCLGICGLISGIFQELGRTMMAISFIMANAVTTFYINQSTYIIISLKDIIVSGLVFILTPKFAIEYIRQFFDASIAKAKDQVFYIHRMQDVITNQLKEFSKVFYQLSKTFNKITKGASIEGNSKEISKLIDKVVNRVCMDCSLYKKCWEGDFYKTYNNIFNILESLGMHEKLDEDSIEHMMMGCYKFNTLIEETSKVYYDYRQNIRWQRQLDECRHLVSDQLKSISDVIEQLAQEVDMDIHFKREIEDKINLGLDREGIYCREVLVMEKSEDMIEVAIIKKACKGKLECHKIVEHVVSRVIGRPFTCKNRECIYAGGNECTIYLEEAKKFNIITGIAQRRKEHKDTIGDSHTSIELSGAKFMLALSDGMGSGDRAAMESADVLYLLEDFMEAGFDLDITVKTINSVLMVRSRDEIFATADICLIDQRSGHAEFAKIGAVSTFLKRGDAVDVIKASSLPIGIIENIKMSREHVRLRDNDMVIMVTDGILDAYEGSLDADDWLSGIITSQDIKTPERMAEYILDSALRAGKGIASDDMTVMVSRVWKPVK
ncbi:MAG: stage II sporulation protein E [Clostridiales bacterium]|nr:stage II sporulation protein E [Clostridiales bacterium]